MKRSELIEAAKLWFKHRNWAVESVREIPSRSPILCAEFRLAKGVETKRYLVAQSDDWFDPFSFDEAYDGSPDGFYFPDARAWDSMFNQANLPSLFDSLEFETIVFNCCRAYAVYLPIRTFPDPVEEIVGRYRFPRNVVTSISVPSAFWAMDNLPEWLQRGWPNLMPGRYEDSLERKRWHFHRNFEEKVRKEAERFQRVPTKVEEVKDPVGYRAEAWYREFLETHDRNVLPWATF